MGRDVALQVAAVQRSEDAGEAQSHRENARSGDPDVLDRAEIELADSADEQVGDDEVERAPEHVDRRGRQPLARRLGEGRLERLAPDAGHEMRHGVDEYRTAAEVGEVVEPGHRRHVSS